MATKTELEMSKFYEKYLAEKHELVNHQKIIEYLFNKSTQKITKIKDLIVDYDSTIKTVRLEETDKNAIIVNFMTMNGLFDKYMDLYKKSVYAQKMNLFHLKQQTRERQIINKILYKCENHFKLSYVPNWSFEIKGEHTSLSKRPTVNLEQKYVYDFFGMTMNHGQLVLFVIEFDDEFNNYTNEQHVNDIFRQHTLFQLNINLLRLDKKSDFRKEIVGFLKRIRNTTEYVIQNPMKAIVKAFNTLPASVMKEKMDQFVTDYEYNHLIYLKYPIKREPRYDSDDDDFFDKQIEVDKEPADTAILVHADDLEKVLRKKDKMKTIKKTEADDYMVELLGSEKNNEENIDDFLEHVEKTILNKRPKKYKTNSKLNFAEVELVGGIQKSMNKKSKNTSSFNNDFSVELIGIKK
jgi:hypothetical protein